MADAKVTLTIGARDNTGNVFNSIAKKAEDTQKQLVKTYSSTTSISTIKSQVEKQQTGNRGIANTENKPLVISSIIGIVKVAIVSDSTGGGRGRGGQGSGEGGAGGGAGGMGSLLTGSKSMASALPLGLGILGAVAATAFSIVQSYRQKVMEQAQLSGVGGVGLVTSNEGYAGYGMLQADIQRMRFEAQKNAALLPEDSVASYGTGTGIGGTQAMALLSTIARYGTNGSGGRADFGQITAAAQYGSGAGFTGAKNVEWMQMVSDAVREGTQSGMAGTPDDIAKTMAIFMKAGGRNNIWQARGLAPETGIAAMKGLAGNMNQAGMLEGGALQEQMFAAVLMDVQKRNPRLSQEAAMSETSRLLSDQTETGNNLKLFKQLMQNNGQSVYEQSINLARASNKNYNVGNALATNEIPSDTARGGMPYGTIADSARMTYERMGAQNELLLTSQGIKKLDEAAHSCQIKLLEFASALGKGIDWLLEKMKSPTITNRAEAIQEADNLLNFRTSSGHN